MKIKMDISSQKETAPTSYKEKYDRLKKTLNATFLYIETSYQTSPETLLINAADLDLELKNKEINHKQAYFNLLNTCYEKTKNNSLAVFVKADPEQISRLNLKNLSHDILLRKDLPTEIKKEDPPSSILTPEGLFQPNPNYYEPSVNKNKHDKFNSPAPKGSDGLIQTPCSFKEDIYSQFSRWDTFLVELMDSVDFLGEEKTTSYKLKIKNDADFENDVTNLVQEIIIDVYNHSKVKSKVDSKDKKTCLSIVDSYLIAKKGSDFYEDHKTDFYNISVTKEQYINYEMDQWIENRKNNTNHPSFNTVMLSLLKPRTDELIDFTYNLKKNGKKSDEKRTYKRYYPSKESTEFNDLLIQKNPIIAQAFHKKYEIVKPEIRTKLKQFIQGLDQFESEVSKLQLQADLLRDKSISKTIKSQYFNTLKLNPERIRMNLLRKYDQLQRQLEDLFSEPSIRESSAGSHVITIVLGAALIAFTVACAVLLNPLLGLCTVFGLGFVGLGAKGLFSNAQAAPKIISHAYTQGEKAIKSFETDETMEESKTEPEDNKPTKKF